MAKYTIELNALLSTGYDIGLKDYPIPSFADEEWRTKLNNKIINHYRFREICHTAPDRWKLYINNTMNEIMPVKNMMYEALAKNWEFNTGADFSEVIEENSKLNSASTGKTNSSETGNSSSNGYSLQVNSDTPGQLLNVESEIEANTYASSASKNKSNASGTVQSNSTANSESTGNSTGERTLTRTKRGAPYRSNASLYKEYIEAINNVDMEIIDALDQCFIGIF